MSEEMNEFQPPEQPEKEDSSEITKEERIGVSIFSTASDKLRETWLTIAANVEDLKTNVHQTYQEIKKVKNWANIAMLGLVLSVGSINPPEQNKVDDGQSKENQKSAEIISAPVTVHDSMRNLPVKPEPQGTPVTSSEINEMRQQQNELRKSHRSTVESKKNYNKDPENLVSLLDQVDNADIFKDLDPQSKAAYENPNNTIPELATGITNLVEDNVLKEFLKLRRVDKIDHIIQTIHFTADKYHRGSEYLFIIADQESAVGANKDKATVRNNWVGYKDPTLPGNPFATFKRWETSFDYLGTQLYNYDIIWPSDEIHKDDTRHDLPGALAAYSPAYENPTSWRIRQAQLLIEDWRKITYLLRKGVIQETEVGELVNLSYDRVAQTLEAEHLK